VKEEEEKREEEKKKSKKRKNVPKKFTYFKKRVGYPFWFMTHYHAAHDI
jgi:hypothetical protein